MKKQSKVFQEDGYGCAPAAIATVLGKTYEEVTKDFFRDFSAEGIDLSQTIAYLGDAGCSVVHMYTTNYSHKDMFREMLLEPFAPIHIVRIRPRADTDLGHLIVMFGDGELFCPHEQSEEAIKSSYMVTDVLGIWTADESHKLVKTLGKNK